MQPFLKFLHLLAFKVQCGLKSEAASNYLGFLWWILEPALYLATFYFVFETLLKRGGPGFVVYLLCGLIPWLWFAKSVSGSSGSIFSGKALLTQVKIPIALLPTASVAQNMVKQVVVFILLIVFLLVYGIEPSWHWVAVPVLVLIQLALVLAASFFIAALVPLFPDLRFLIQTGLMLMMFASGIFYRAQLILEQHQTLFYLNPMATMIKAYRDVLLNHQWPDWSALGIVFAASVAFLVGLVWFFLKKADFYPRVVAES